MTRLYCSRWKIEKYFQYKKPVFQFENFRARKLTAINALNFYITLCMTFLARLYMKPETNVLKATAIKTSDPIKEKVWFSYYRLAKGVSSILIYAKESNRLWFKPKVLRAVNSALSWSIELIKEYFSHIPGFDGTD